jgi:peptidoglycan/LPS O-acetylase OafA/YrhL
MRKLTPQQRLVAALSASALAIAVFLPSDLSAHHPHQANIAHFACGFLLGISLVLSIALLVRKRCAGSPSNGQDAGAS